ncbi:hypothetical protein PA25_35870 [Pseudoalteromonas sp. A25]|uniref:hypothetical protein n=1 Tax=Pseudoalteromonas sp. A25 TaxID=116092 RepID=UPI00126040EB|nr:hypothetical protein [Pseudoalteromonas sp. A25]BBN83602.1 hypothetical protein PA25_35870 [Pseudoalteromonas sp. A25]
MPQFKLSAVVLCAMLASACSSETTNSNLVKTEAIWSDIYVTSNGNDSRVIAELNVSSRNGNNLNLVAGDKLSVVASNDALSQNMTKDMTKDIEFFDIDYRATFPYHEADTQYEVKLYRSSEKKTLTSIVTLPESIFVIAPQQAQRFEVDQPLELRWAKALKIKGNQSLEIQLTSLCKKDDNEISNAYTFTDVADTGMKTINFDDINIFKNDELNSSFDCSIDFEFERKRYGTVDSRYASGSRAYAKTHATLKDIKITLK